MIRPDFEQVHPAMRRATSALLIAWWCALALSAVQLLHAGFRYRILDQIVWHSRDIVWMAPLGNLLVFSAAALPIAALGLLLPPASTRRLSIGVFGALAALGVFLLFPRIHPAASLILAGGLGARIAYARDTIWSRRSWRLAGIGLGVAIACVIIGQVGREQLMLRRERSAVASPDGAAPNVLLLIWDTVRAASMSLHGHSQRTTPALDRWSREGIVFDWAFSPAPWTLPSHASIMTGVAAGDQTGDWRTPLDGGHPALAELLASRGFATAGFVGNLNYTHSFSGLRRGFVGYDEHRRSVLQVLFSTPYLQPLLLRRVLRSHAPAPLARLLSRVSMRVEPPYWAVEQKLDGSITDAFLHWQRGLGRQPFFAFLNYYNAHQYWAPADFAPRFGPDSSLAARYERAIAYLDAEVERALDSLRVRGVLDNTLVILTSDHGELLGEHGLYDHGNGLYLPSLHVPLVLRYPPLLPAGRRVDHVVSLRDLPHTILSTVLPGESAALPGRSLLEHLSPSAADSVHVVLAEVSKGIGTSPDWPVSRGDMTSFIDATHHYIRNEDGTEQLFAYRADPGEQHNLVTVPGASRVLDAFRKRFDAMRRERGP